MGDNRRVVSVAKDDEGIAGSAEPAGCLDDGIQDGLHIGRRLRDDPQHLRHCRLVLQRLAELVVRERSSASRREFSMAITAWSAKVATSLVCASSNGRTSWRKIASTPTI